MNVLIANKNKEVLQNLSIDVIKKMEGEFEIEEIISNFKNFYFQRMIIDITALKNYKDIKTLQKLSISLDMDKIILLLDSEQTNVSRDYLSQLISMGIYNFTQNSDGIMYLYNNPNTYRDVAQYHQLQAATSEDVPAYATKEGPRIIGFKNINDDAGATTLIYMIKKELEKQFSVVALEVDKRDFVYFREKDMHGTNSTDVTTSISKYNKYNIVLIDINDSLAAENICDEVYYLLQPSTLKLNKLMLTDAKSLIRYKEKKVVLNQSLLSSKDILDFEYESKTKVFYNLPPLDDRERESHALKGFLTKIGFKNQNNEEVNKKNKLLGIFNI